MNAFGEALNLGFMRRSEDFSSGSMPMDSISRLHSHEFKFLFPAYGLNLRMHSHEFLSPCQIFGVFWLGTTHVLPPLFKTCP